MTRSRIFVLLATLVLATALISTVGAAGVANPTDDTIAPPTADLAVDGGTTTIVTPGIAVGAPPIPAFDGPPSAFWSGSLGWNHLAPRGWFSCAESYTIAKTYSSSLGWLGETVTYDYGVLTCMMSIFV